MTKIQEIKDFIQSSENTINLGIINYGDRRAINEFCHNNNLHTYSLHCASESIPSYDSGVEPIKELCVSKIPFKITDIQLETSVVNELKFITGIGNYDRIDDMLMGSRDEDRSRIEKFLHQFSFEFSNNYCRLFVHRKDIVNKAKEAISQIKIPTPKNLANINSSKTFFTPENHKKMFVRFDMINAVSAIIGIKDWVKFMTQFTKIELYTTSKPL